MSTQPRIVDGKAIAPVDPAIQFIESERIVKRSLLLPTDPKTLERLAQLLEVATKADPEKDWPYEKSIEWCRRSLAIGLIHFNQPRNATANVILGMSLQKLNRRDDALAELAKGGKLIETAFQRELPRGDGGAGFWFDWVIARILLREGEELLQQESAVSRLRDNGETGVMPDP